MPIYFDRSEGTKKLKHNILNIYGRQGENWLASLPSKVKQLQKLWGLSQLKPFSNLSYSYVLKGLQDKTPIILKLSPDVDLIDKEAKALNAFKGFGAVSVLGLQDGALLLERAIPGDLLKDKLPQENRIEIACKVIEGLHKAPFPIDSSFPHIEELLAAIDKELNLPKKLLEMARTLKKELLKSYSNRQVLLHGDLHQENILSNRDEWQIIDPKGVIGHPIHDLLACVKKPSYDLKYICKYFGYPFNDIVKWYYVRLILAACWQIEDHLDPSPFLKLAKETIPLFKSKII